MPTTWSVLLWMAVQDGLEAFADKDVSEAQAAFAGDGGAGLEVSICLNQNDGSSIIDPRTDARTPGVGVTSVEQHLEMRQGNWRSSDQRVLILWGHGDEPGPNPQAAIQARTVPEPGMIVEIFQRHSDWPLPTVIGYDACTMALADVLAELARITEGRPPGPMPILVASQIDEPAEGWPYQTLFDRLLADLDVDAARFASIVVEVYSDLIKAEKDAYSIGAFDPSHITALQDPVRRMVDEQLTMSPKPRATAIFDRIESAQGKGVGNGSYDIKKLAQLLSPGPPADAIAAALKGLTRDLRADDAHKDFGGLSIVLPHESDTAGAAKLSSQFAQDSRWLKFWQECIAGPLAPSTMA